MNLKELDIKSSYISYGDENFAVSLISPALKVAKTYKRSVGFFSSSVFNTIIDGVATFVRNGGKILLICGPQLSEDDRNAIELGYKLREDIVKDCFLKTFDEELNKFSDQNLQLLLELIAKGYMEIQLAVTVGDGIYHDKLGIIEDGDANKIVFYGSPNSSDSAYKKNYEKIRVTTSWQFGGEEIVKDECDEFDALWGHHNPYVQVYSFSENAKQYVINKIEERERGTAIQADEIELRDYQKEAIAAWVNNNYRGFYVMATGTGKTWTAIFSAKELIKKHPCLMVICAPYKHLIKQWAADLTLAFPEAKIIMVSSENPHWEEQLKEEIIRNKYNKDNQVIVVSTIMSFNTEKFDLIIQKSSNHKLLIVDEAHRFKNFDGNLNNKRYQYMLGLSATPSNGKNLEFEKQLLDFFGGKVFDLPIESALERGFLVPYNYYPIFVEATDEEEKLFEYYSKKMAACFENGICKDSDSLIKYSQSRLRVISMATQKKDKIEDILDKVNEKEHLVVYCGDGKLFDKERQEEVRHIQFIKAKLSERGLKSSQFTATENMSKRMQLVAGFNQGELDALVAIRCLDEGINIPSIKGALILASNDDYREFVQRRGRILRLYNQKKFSNIYDVIVLPTSDTPGMATIEFRRFYEYAKLAINVDENMKMLNYYLNMYGIAWEDIVKFDNVEDDLDE